MAEKIHCSSRAKRENYLGWDETFMQMACLIAQRSKDPNSQIGACVVNKDNIVLGLGYNGFPRGCSDDALPWSREGDELNKKYIYVVHAEANAIYNANTSVAGCRLYCNLFPCNECAKTIIQTGIKEVIYTDDFYHDTDACKASRKMLELAGVKYRQYISQYKLQLLDKREIKNTELPESPQPRQSEEKKRDDSQFIFEEIK